MEVMSEAPQLICFNCPASQHPFVRVDSDATGHCYWIARVQPLLSFPKAIVRY